MEKKQLTLEHFWPKAGQTTSKPVGRIPPMNDVPVDENLDVEVKEPVLIVYQRRKRVEKSADGLGDVHVPADVKKTGPGKGWRKGLGKNQLAQKQLGLNSEGAYPDSERDLKKRRLGRLPMVGTKRPDAPSSVQDGNLDVEGKESVTTRVYKRRKRVEKSGSDDVHVPAVKKTGPGRGWRKGLGKNQLAQKQSEGADTSSERDVTLPSGKERRFGRLPMVGTRRGRGSSEDDLPARVDKRQWRTVSSEAAQSDSATETDPDLPQWAREGKRDGSEEEVSDYIPRDLEPLKSAKSRIRNHAQMTEKRRRPAIKRPQIHQQLQLLDQKKPDAEQIETRHPRRVGAYRFVAGDPDETETDSNPGGLIGSASSSSPSSEKAAQSKSRSFPGLAEAFQVLLKANFLRKDEKADGSIPQGLVTNDRRHEIGGKDEQQSRDEGKRVKTKREVTFPLQIGALTVVSLGEIVLDSEHFHEQHYIWPEGYTSIRTFPSAKDPNVVVEYKLQVLRNPSSRSHPLFRVAPADDTPVDGPTPFACLQKALQRLRRAQEKVGKKPELGVQFRSPAHMFGFSNPRVSKLIQSLPNARACTKFTYWTVDTPSDEDVLPAGYHPVDVTWEHLDRCTVCYVDEEYVGNLLLQCDKCRVMVHMSCYGELKHPDGDLWLCNLCRPEAPKTRPPCCLCPVTSGAMIKTTDGRWSHIMCAMWIPETFLVDGMEPVDGVNAVAKERWGLTCSICKVPYGACIQCSGHNCRTAFHPLCARSAGLYMQVHAEKDLSFLAYCRRHKQPTNRTLQPTPTTGELPVNASGCARSEPYNAAARRGRQEPDALAAALAKRLFVENLPYTVTGCRRISPLKTVLDRSNEVLSDTQKHRIMKSSLSQRLVFGKSAIHGMGVFTKQTHCANDMLIEYVGEVIRPVIADLREKRCYDSVVGPGTYMFRVDDERVVDATRAGNIAHLMNHSCESNCYSRIIPASGKDRIIIFAKRDIEIGEELTYDYRFESKADEPLTCHCGSVGCRGFVNLLSSDGDPSRLSVKLAELIKLPGATTRGHTH